MHSLCRKKPARISAAAVWRGLCWRLHRLGSGAGRHWLSGTSLTGLHSDQLVRAGVGLGGSLADGLVGRRSSGGGLVLILVNQFEVG